jgi:hypothetical protein
MKFVWPGCMPGIEAGDRLRELNSKTRPQSVKIEKKRKEKERLAAWLQEQKV